MSQRRRIQRNISTKQLKIAIYIRVSTHWQVDRDSLPFQRSELENYCKYILLTDNFVIFEDAGYSAKNTNRPSYQEMMTRIRAGEFTHLLVWKLDRISRNLRDFTEMWDELQDYGISFISKMEQFDTSSAMGEAMLRIILVFAELERKMTAERVFNIMLSRAEKGLWNGAPVPIGYDWDPEAKAVKINSEEAEIVQSIYNKYEELGSTPAVAKWLDTYGVKTKRGGRWTSKTVNDVLRSPTYVGNLRWNYREAGRGEKKDPEEVIIIEDAVPRIIPHEQWARIQELLDGNFKGAASARDRAKHTHILSGLIRCGRCGKNYVASVDRPRVKSNYTPSRYRCLTYTHQGSCSSKILGGLTIEPFVLEYIRAYAKVSKDNRAYNKALMRAFGHPEIEFIDAQPRLDVSEGIKVLDEVTSATPDENDVLDELRRKKGQVEQAISRLDDAFLYASEAGAMARSEYLVKRADMLQRLARVDAEIGAHQANAKPKTVADFELISRFLLAHSLLKAGDIRERLPSIDREIVQGFLQQLISYIEVIDDKVTKIAFHSPDGDEIHRFIYKA